jgi:predicted site-specific integrase-resolvase
MSLISKDFYNAEELAKLKGVHVKSVYRWIRAGVAPPYETFAGMYWFHKKQAEAWQQPKAGRK